MFSIDVRKSLISISRPKSFVHYTSFNMLLSRDFPFTADLILKLISKYQGDNHIDEDNLNEFKDNEKLECISCDELEKRLDKSFKVDVEFVQTIVKAKLKQSDLVRLAHFAIEIANEQSNKNRTNSDEESQATKDRQKKRKQDEPTVSFNMVVEVLF